MSDSVVNHDDLTSGGTAATGLAGCPDQAGSGATAGAPVPVSAAREAGADPDTDLPEIPLPSLVSDLPTSAPSPQAEGHGPRGPAAPAAEPGSGVSAGEGTLRYRVIGLLGEGGMGKVYLANDRDLGRHVALKVVRSPAASAIRRLIDEAQVLAQLDHPNIVPLFDLGRAGKEGVYYTMRVVQGRTLAQVIALLAAGDESASREYSLARRMQVFVHIAQALDYAHARGVIHRDLKPANVMLGAHGEVQVMDWGLAKLTGDSAIELGDDPMLTAAGAMVGTPSYMAPEQARRGEVSARSDVYALGIILYELLTLERLFGGPTREVILAHATLPPPRPRSRPRGGAVPEALEALCLRALEKDPGRRPQAAAELVAAVQGWLESEVDRERRHELAEARASDGAAALASYRGLCDEVERRQLELREIEGRVELWRPAPEKLELFTAQDRLEAARRAVVGQSAVVVETLERALEYEPANATARARLADYYWLRFAEADRHGDEQGAFFAQRLRQYHDGRYARELAGDGTLTLVSEPEGAEVLLFEMETRGLVLVPARPRSLGHAPIDRIPLAMGSYLAVLRREGYRDCRYPIWISRNRDWSGTVRLFSEEEIGAGFVHVPAGTFLQGGDPDCRGYALARAEPFVDDFFLSVHPVTAGEYLEFLNDLARTDGLAAASRRGPRPARDAPTYFPEDGHGALTLPPPPWRAELPALGISREDAESYCAWRSLRDQRALRLPTEAEWEKAARGVDGRWFPWGWRFDPSLCNMALSQREQAIPVSIHDFPDDLSVYGVRGMAGNARDWTATDWEGGAGGRSGETFAVIRGGAWAFNPIDSRCAYRNRIQPWAPNDNFSFRVAVSPQRRR